MRSWLWGLLALGLCGGCIDDGTSALVCEATPPDCSGDFQVYDEDTMAVAAMCVEIDGSLVITDLPPGFELSLPCLERVSGGVTVSHTALSNLHGLSSLKSVSQLQIWNNTALTDLRGLTSLVEIRGGLNVENNSALTSLRGIDGLFYVATLLCISGNPQLLELGGLDKLMWVMGDVRIHENAMMCQRGVDAFVARLVIDGKTDTYGNNTDC